MNIGVTRTVLGQRRTWVLFSGLCALTLVVGLSLLLSHFQVRAEPPIEIAAANLILQKDVSAEIAEPGETLTYTIRVENAGDTATSAWLTDTLPGELSYVTDTFAATFGSWGVKDQTITWTADLVGYNYAVLSFAAEISSQIDDVEIVNTAQVTGAGTLVEDSATTMVPYYVYMPLIVRRWPPVPYAVTLTDIENPEEDGDYTVAWSYGGAYPVETEPLTYTLQEATQADLSDWTIAYEGGGTAVGFAGKAGGTYYYRVRGSNAHGTGAWSEVKSTSVAGAPFAPDLDEILNEDEDQYYRVSWSYDEAYPDVTTPDSYTLQEAEDQDFTEGLKEYDPATEEDCVVGSSGGYCDLDNDSGTYYYRVRGENQDGLGPWSNVEEVWVWEYEDDFSDHESGWPRVWERTRGAVYQVRPYEVPECGPGKDCKYEDGDGYVVSRRAESNPRAQFTPGVEIPSTKYQLEVDARWFEAEFRATYEILFSAEKDFDTYYAVKVRIPDPPDGPNDPLPQCQFRLVKVDDDETTYMSGAWEGRDEIHCGVLYCFDDESCGTTAWNEWKIERDDKQIKVEVNGHELGTWQDSDPFGSNRVFGLGATLYEGLTPSKAVFDKIEVELED